MRRSEGFQNIPPTKIFLPSDAEDIRRRHDNFRELYFRIKDGLFSRTRNEQDSIPYGYQVRTERSEGALSVGKELVEYLQRTKERHQREYDEFQRLNPRYKSKAWWEKRENLERERNSKEYYFQSTIEETAVFFDTNCSRDNMSRVKVIDGSVERKRLEHDPSVLGFKAFSPILDGIDGSILQKLLHNSDPDAPAKVADLTPGAHQHIFGTVFPLVQPGAAFETRLTRSDGIVIVHFYPTGDVKPHPVLLMLPRESFRQSVKK